LGLRLQYVGNGPGPAVIQVLGELQRPGVVGDRVIEQLLLGIQAAAREVVTCELCAHREIERRNIPVAGLLAARAPATVLRTRPKRPSS